MAAVRQLSNGATLRVAYSAPLSRKHVTPSKGRRATEKAARIELEETLWARLESVREVLADMRKLTDQGGG